MILRNLLLFVIPACLLCICYSCDTYNEDAIDPATLNQWMNYSTSNGLSDNRVNTIFKDESGKIWVGTVQGGVNCYDGTGWITYTVNDGLLSDNVYAIAQDKDGDIWFGTTAGANVMLNNEIFYFEYLEGLPVYCFLNGKDNIFWIGSNGYGLVLFDYYEFVPLYFENPDYNYIKEIILDESGTVWIGTDGGALFWDGTVWGTFDESNGLYNNKITDIIEDSWGDLWFSSIEGEFLTRYNGQKSEYISLFKGLSSGIVTSMIEDMNHNIWFASAWGIIKYNGAEMVSIQLPSAFSEELFVYSEMDANGNLWFATAKNGILIYITE